MTFTLARRVTAEAFGTGLIDATVVGSGIMADKLAGGNVALALLGNTLPTGAILVVLILALGPISGVHFNPAVSLVMALNGGLTWRDTCPAYVIAWSLWRHARQAAAQAARISAGPAEIGRVATIAPRKGPTRSTSIETATTRPAVASIL